MYYCQFTVTKSCNVYFLSLIGYNSILVEFFSTKQVITMLNQLNPVHALVNDLAYAVEFPQLRSGHETVKKT